MIPQRIFYCFNCDLLSIFAQDLAQRRVQRGQIDGL